VILEVPGLISVETATQIAEDLKSAPFDDGKLTARGKARDIKHNLQLDYDHEASVRWGSVIAQAIRDHRTVKDGVLPLTVLPLRFCKYERGMSYGEHIDKPVMRKDPIPPVRTDVAVTIWLTPKSSYDGGELVMRGPFGERAVKGDAGTAVFYPANTWHRVSEVTRGERVVAVSWIQSMVRAAEQRTILFELALSIGGIAGRPDLGRDVLALQRVRNDLLRMWAET
jgi:PKHD-type hydroxylase